MPPPFRTLVPAAVGLTLLGTEARAGGVLVRLDADRVIEGEVFVELQPTEGDSEQVQLQDDGQQPDVTAGDGGWAGALFLPHTDVNVTLVMGGTRIEGGDVSWSAPDIPRDLDLSLRGDTLEVKAREANPHGVGNGDGPGSGPSSAVSGNGDDTTEQELDEGLLLIGGGAALLVTLGMGVLVLRRKERIRRGPVAGVIIQKPGGFMGPNSPPMHDGLVHWQLKDDEGESVLRALVTSLARHHGVLVVGPDLPDGLGQSGRRIFTDSDASPRRVGDVLEAIHDDPREAGVVVFYGVTGSADDWADRDDELPIGSGGVVLHGSEATAVAPSHHVRVCAPGVCTVAHVSEGTGFYIGDRARWPATSPSVVVSE